MRGRDGRMAFIRFVPDENGRFYHSIMFGSIILRLFLCPEGAMEFVPGF